MKTHHRRFAALLTAVFLTASFACTSTGRQGAVRGAGYGAAAGAAGGALSAAIFGNDIGDAVVRGAAWGAGSGAVSGAIAGDQQHKAQESREAAQRQQEVDREIARLKKEIGPDALSGVQALMEGKHEVALGYARTAQADSNRKFSMAGYWLEALTYVDRGDDEKVRELLPRLADDDPTTSDAADASRKLDELERGLDDLRREFGLS